MPISIDQLNAHLISCEIASPTGQLLVRKWDDPKKATSQDRVFIAANSNRSVYVLLDGMGGLELPYEAARVCGEALLEAWQVGTPADLIVHCNRALNAALGVNRAGATVAVLISTDEGIEAGWLGDVRVYAGGTSLESCVTADHSKLAEFLGVNPSGDEVRANKKLADNVRRSLGETEILDHIPTTRIEIGTDIYIASDGAWSSRSFAEMTRAGAVATDVDLDDDASVICLLHSGDGGPVLLNDIVVNI